MSMGELNRKADRLRSNDEKDFLFSMDQLYSQLAKNVLPGSFASGIDGASHAQAQRMAEVRKMTLTGCSCDGHGGIRCVTHYGEK